MGCECEPRLPWPWELQIGEWQLSTYHQTEWDWMGSKSPVPHWDWVGVNPHCCSVLSTSATTRRLRMQNGWQWEVRGVRCDSPIATENGLGSEPMVVKMMPTRTNNKQSWVVLIWCGINPLAARIWCVTITSSNATTNGCYWALTASQNDDDGESSLHWEELDLLELRECGEESPLHQLLSSVVEGFNIMCPNCHCFMLLPVADSSYSYYSCSTWSPSTHPSPNTLLVCCMLGAGGSSLFSSHCSPHGSA